MPQHGTRSVKNSYTTIPVVHNQEAAFSVHLQANRRRTYLFGPLATSGEVTDGGTVC